jgi:hypothetical protein
VAGKRWRSARVPAEPRQEYSIGLARLHGMEGEAGLGRHRHAGDLSI